MDTECDGIRVHNVTVRAALIVYITLGSLFPLLFLLFGIVAAPAAAAIW